MKIDERIKFAIMTMERITDPDNADYLMPTLNQVREILSALLDAQREIKVRDEAIMIVALLPAGMGISTGELSETTKNHIATAIDAARKKVGDD